MAGGEVSAIAEMANIVSCEIFNWFKWTRFPLMDQNFKCLKTDKHAPPKKQKEQSPDSAPATTEASEQERLHKHPVDVVFSYIDPYTAQRVMLNTDLKSYKSGSISKTMIRSALKSLAVTIDCARSSPEWKGKYNHAEDSEVRGLLFVYNHDGEYDKKFYDVFKSEKVDGSDKGQGKVDLSNFPVCKGQQIHIIEPRTINYLLTIKNDSANLHTEGSFPESEYFFHYPELTLHKTKLPKEARPATIELLSAPYMIIEHNAVKKWNEKSEKLEERFGAGFIVYYNRSGSTVKEFIYLLDTLSNLQILDRDCSLRLRIACDAPSQEIRSNFEAAKTSYAGDWGFDEYKKQKLERIDLKVIEIVQKKFSETEIGWRDER